MKNNLFFTISGLRGIVGETFTPELVAKISAHFGNLIEGGEIVVGRDTRKSGEMIKSAVISGLLSAGCMPCDIGIVPTPTVLFAVKKKKSKGGIAVTASHNPPEWNALKFVKSNGTFLREEDIEYLKKLMDKDPLYKKGEEIKTVENEDFLEKHLEAIVKNNTFKVEEIKEKNFKVVIDAANGAASYAAPALLERLNCSVIKVNCDRPGEFEREPEPTSENLISLQKTVIETEADIGFATDADGDRLVISLREGKILSEEYTLPLFIYYMLSKINTRKPIVTNYSTSRMIDFVARRHRVSVKRTKVGEAFVVEKMEKEGSILGGEGNGGIIYREINFTRDALVGIAGILSLLCEIGDSREFENIIPRFYMKKIKVPLTELIYEDLEKAFNSEESIREDGILLNFEDGFLHIRPSNTEPVIRIIGEFKEERRLKESFDKALRILR